MALNRSHIKPSGVKLRARILLLPMESLDVYSLAKDFRARELIIMIGNLARTANHNVVPY